MPINNEEGSLNKIPATSPDVRKDLLKKIREIYPALFGEGDSLNAQELQALVDDYAKPEAERYSFPWAGKTASKRFAFTPSKARLVPDKERSVDFDTTQNLIIEGENLEVLKLLQASYFKKVKMIYIDPPYNTGHDFVYPDDYSESKQAYWEKGGVTQEGVRVDTNTESSGRYHSNWLSMMQSRLLLARNLLRDDGVIFVSIDDNEVHNLRRLMDEVFSESNSLTESPSAMIWQRYGSTAGHLANAHEYLLCYAKNKEMLPFFKLDDFGDDLVISHGALKKISKANPASEITFPAGIEFEGEDAEFEGEIGGSEKEMIYGKMVFKNGKLAAPVTIRAGWGMKDQILSWLKGEETLDSKGQRLQKLYFNSQGILCYEKERGTIHPKTILPTDVGNTKTGSEELNEIFGFKVFDYPKPSSLLKYIYSFTTQAEDIILDFFSGSGTTAHAVMELNKETGGNRKFILVQLPEATDEVSEACKAGYKTISQITIERAKRAGAKIKTEKPEVDTGFKVLRLAKSLFPQNLFEVDPDMTEEQKIKAWEEYLEKSKQAHLFDYKPDELLVEIALKDGFDLNFKAEPIKGFEKNNVLDVSDGEKTALVCLDESIQEDTIKALESYKERRFICLERAVDSTRKWNLKRLFGDNLWVA